MKLVWVVPHFPPHIGGGEKLYYDVCRGLTERGYEVRVLTSSSGGVSGYHRVEGMDVYYFDWTLKFGHPVVRASDIREHIKWCDIVHTTIYSTALTANRLALREGKPCVTTIHEVMGNKWFWFENNPLKAIAFWIYEYMIVQKAHIVHVVSDATLNDYNKAAGGSGKAYMIYNFPDLPLLSETEKEEVAFRRCFGLEDGERGILYFGRPAPNKGIFVLFEAIKLLADRGQLAGKVKFCMIIAPNPPVYYKKAMKKIEQYGIGKYLIIRPSMERNMLLKVLSGADCCVIPSITEGFGYTAVEACTYKIPVISSDAGSLPEVVSGKCLFFKNRNAEDLADKLRMYIDSDIDSFDDVKEKNFDRETVLDEYLKMYEEVL
jgi:glycosyltransferase involved in cell wall biosynthesis